MRDIKERLARHCLLPLIPPGSEDLARAAFERIEALEREKQQLEAELAVTCDLLDTTAKALLEHLNTQRRKKTHETT